MSTKREVNFMELKEVMQRDGLSQRKLSIMAKMTSQDLNQVINGKKPFFPAWRKRISSALGMSEEELFPEYQVTNKEI